MKKLIVKDLNIGTSTNIDGNALKLALVPFFKNGETVCVSFKDTTPISSSFYNSSFGELINAYSYEKFKKTVTITDITKTHFEMIKKFIAWQQI